MALDPNPNSVAKGILSRDGTLSVARQIQIENTGFSGMLASVTNTQAMAAIVDALMVNGGTPGMVSAAMVSYDNSNALGIFSAASVDTVQETLDLVDGTGIGSQPVTFTGSFFASWGQNGNQDTWYGGRQTLTLSGARNQVNGRYTFEFPNPTELGLAFDDLASRGLAEVLTRTIEYNGGSSTSIARNRLTVTAPSVSVGFVPGTFPTTIGQGMSATFRVERIGGTIQPIERLSVQQAVDPVATFGEVVLQTRTWNNADGSLLPGSGEVLKGYAFRVAGSNPNDGTLRQGLLDAGVSDRVINDGDYVVWDADAFTSWTDGDNWFVWERTGFERTSRAASNFHEEISEIDNRVDLGNVSQAGAQGLVWLSENDLAEAPFITPSTDPNNPRSGDDYAYVGGQENRNGQLQFQLGHNLFQSHITVGVSPNFITAHGEANIDVVIADDSGVEIQRFNLANDFTFTDDATFTNSTFRHYKHNATINYPFLATITVVLTEVQRHFRFDPTAIDVTQNVFDLPESQLSATVREKINRAIPDQGVTYAEIEDRLEPIISVTHADPAHDARFLSYSGTGAYPTQLSDFTQVSAANPQFTNNNTSMFVVVPSGSLYVLKNITTNAVLPFVQSSTDVNAVESFTEGGVTYFVYLITNQTSGHVYEVERTTVEQVRAYQNELNNHEERLDKIDAELTHAALNLDAEVVHFLQDLTVTEESTPTVNSTTYNNQLSGSTSTTQSVFYEPSENAGASGLKNSRPLSELSGDQVQRKLLYIPPSQPASQASYITAFDGTTGRDLISYINGSYFAIVREPGQPASTVTDTIYPAPQNRVAGEGIWQTVEALTFVNGVPRPEADELFFTRNIPTSPTTITIDYRGHANGNVFGAGQTTLTGVGGPNETFADFTLNDGSEQAFVEVRYYPNRNGNNQHEIRVSVTERVNAGLPTINDIQVILSYTEQRTIPATSGFNRQVEIEGTNADGWQVFAFKPASNGNLIVVGDRAEVDLNRSYTTYFGAGLTGFITVADENARFLNYEDFTPIASTVQNLEDHASLPQLGLFVTDYTRETVVSTDVTLRPDGFNVGNLPTSATGLVSGDLWNNSGTLAIVP